MEFKSEGKVNGLTRQKRFDGQGKSVDSRTVNSETCFLLKKFLLPLKFRRKLHDWSPRASLLDSILMEH